MPTTPEDIYRSVELDDKDGMRNQRQPLLVDNLGMGKSPMQSVRTSCKQLIRNPYVWVSIFLFVMLLKLTNIGQSAPHVDVSAVLKSNFSSSNPEAIAKLTRQDIQCQHIGDRLYDETSCLGPPYLYVTFHGSHSLKHHWDHVHQVCKFTRDGCAMGAVLMPSTDGYIPETLRGISINPKTQELYTVDSYRGASQVRVFSQCNSELDNRREPLKVIMAGDASDPGLIHPYGIDFNPVNDEIYVSVQGSYGVLHYLADGTKCDRSIYLENHLKSCKDEHQPGCKGVTVPDQDLYRHLSSSLFKSNQINDSRRREMSSYNFTNSFAIFDKGEVRGVTTDIRGNIFVANKTEGIHVFDIDGMPLKRIQTVKESGGVEFNVIPVSLFYDKVWA
eukprot:GHVH01004473.1.p1 GENE.GHVH01004473.1~~GHVH01004473.1.p1  ORF type:complete len:400 (+),score=28.01 GHVH01004473.1:35-1201(+)